MADDFPKTFYEGTSNNSAGFVTPYKLGSGVMRGTQIIQNTDGSQILLGKIPNMTSFGIAFYDSGGNLLSTLIGATTTNYDGSGHKMVVQGLLSDGSYGTAYYDTAGNLITKIVAGTTYIYDPINGNVNVMQTGKLPDSTYGFGVAATGKNVADGIS